MGNRTNLYVLCLVLFPVAFAAFVVGFSLPVWQGNDTTNSGLWQACENVIKNCDTFNFDSGGDWFIGVRVVEIFALAMHALAAVDLVYENCNARFRLRPLKERLNCGVLCMLGGLGGLAGVIVYVVKLEDLMVSGWDFGWSLYLVGSGSGLTFFLSIGFLVSAVFFEKPKQPYAKSGPNGHGPPFVTSNDQNYELAAYTNRGMFDDAGNSTANMGGLNVSRGDNLPGFAMYNGLVNRPGYRSSLPMDAGSTAQVLPPFPPGRAIGGGGGLQPAQSQLKGPGYYSLSDERVLDPSFDLSEGYQPAPSRPQQRPPPGYYGRNDDPYYRSGLSSSRREDPYSRGGGDPYNRRGEESYSPYVRGGGARLDGGRDGGLEDPYSRYHREPTHQPPRAGYNDPFGFDRPPSRAGPGGDPFDRGGGVPRDSFYRPGRF